VPRILPHGLPFVTHHPFPPAWDLVNSFEIAIATGLFLADCALILTLQNNYKKLVTKKNGWNISTFNQILWFCCK
jgi:hypothetical protein